MDKPAHGKLVRGVALDGAVRVFAAETTVACEEARSRHDLWPTAAAAVGRALTASAIMAADLKEPGSVVLRFRGDGPLGGITAEGRRPRNREGPIAVRGYASEPHVHLDLNERNKLDVGGAVGRGTLYVVRDSGRGEPYSGVAELVSGEIAEDLAHYFLQSEQRRTAVALGVLVETDGHVRAAGGLLVELLPGASPEVAADVERNVARLGGVSRAVDAGAGAEEIAREALGTVDAERLDSIAVAFRCACSRRRLRAALVSLGARELTEIIEDDGEAELRCRFCGRRYHFDRAELESLRAVAAGAGLGGEPRS